MERRLSSFFSMQSGESKHAQPIAVEGQCLPQWSNEWVLKAKSSEKRTRDESKTCSHHPLTLYCALNMGQSTVCTTRFQTSSFFWVKWVLWIQFKQKQTGQTNLQGPHAFTTLEHTLTSLKPKTRFWPLPSDPAAWQLDIHNHVAALTLHMASFPQVLVSYPAMRVRTTQGLSYSSLCCAPL